MKKMLVYILAALTLSMLCACGSNADMPNVSSSPSPAVTDVLPGNGGEHNEGTKDDGVSTPVPDVTEPAVSPSEKP